MQLCKNVFVNGRRTSMRLDKETCSALSDICRKEKMSLGRLCSLIDDQKGESSLSALVRLFALVYYRRMLAKYEQVPPADTAVPSARVSQILSTIHEG